MAPIKPSGASNSRREGKRAPLLPASAKPRGIDKRTRRNSTSLKKALREPRPLPKRSSRLAGATMKWDPHMGGSLFEVKADGNHAVSSLDNHAKPWSGQPNLHNEREERGSNSPTTSGKSMASLLNKQDQPSPKVSLSSARKATGAFKTQTGSQESDDEDDMDAFKPCNRRRRARGVTGRPPTPETSDVESRGKPTNRRLLGKTSRLAPNSASSAPLASTQKFSSRYGSEETERNLVGALTVDASGESYLASFCFDGCYDGRPYEQVAEIKATMITEEKRNECFHGGASYDDDVGLAVRSLFEPNGYPSLEVSRNVDPTPFMGTPLLYVDLVHILPAHQGKGLIGGILHTFRALLREAEGPAKFMGTMILMPGNPYGEAGEVYEGGDMSPNQIAKRLKGIYEKKDGFVTCSRADGVLVVMARGVMDDDLIVKKKKKKGKGKGKGKARL